MDEPPLRKAMLRYSVEPAAAVAADHRHHRGLRLSRRCTICSCGRCGGSPATWWRSAPIRKTPTASSCRPVAPTRSAPPSASSPPCRPNSPRCCSRRTGSPHLGSRCRRSTTICATCSARRSSFPTACRACPIPSVQRFAPKLMRALERAIAFCQSTLSYGRLQEPPPDRRPILLEPLVDEVHETLGLGPDAPIRWISAVERGLVVEADYDQLFRILLNLARNALQALESRAAARPRPRSDPHHRPARGRGRRHRGLRHRPRLFRTGARASVRGVPGFDQHRRRRSRPRHRRRTRPRPWRRNPPRRRHDRRDVAADHSRPRRGVERASRRPRARMSRAGRAPAACHARGRSGSPFARLRAFSACSAMDRLYPSGMRSPAISSSGNDRNSLCSWLMRMSASSPKICSA